VRECVCSSKEQKKNRFKKIREKAKKEKRNNRLCLCVEFLDNCNIRYHGILPRLVK